MTVPYDFERLERVRHVTAYYVDYQGLYMLVVALFALNLLLVRGGSLEPLIIGLPLLVALGFLVRWYYRWRFGQVRALFDPGRISAYVLLPFGLLILSMAGGTLSAQAGWTYGPLGIGGLVFTLLFVLLACPHWRMRAHYLVAAAAVGLASLLPLGMLLPSGVHPLSYAATDTLLVTLAAVLCVGGLLDHRTLVRTLPPVTDAATENGTA
ncbi:hypothetical protein [Nocardiopsis metallicus]|uniref:Uncharacterized protein n=1 Tax=Nocardiopsis metallicus TaxID=179819 RepID=A0A840W8Y4_9ACTN|nr:hypothetical protein [Nocardiopsis metallicus]MBB5492574.1 hypothetical protein [Nocardiopsis metallicus]